MMVILLAVVLVGWFAAAALGTLAYFLGEQSKPIHERNWRSTSFERFSQALTNKEINYAKRIPAFVVEQF